MLKTRIRTVAATVVVAATIAGAGATAAVAAPTPGPAFPTPIAAPSTTAPAGASVPQFWASGVNLTFVNKTDMTFNYVVDEKDTPKTVRPGETVRVPANSTESRYMRVYTEGAGVRVGAHNHSIGTPNAYGSMTVNGQTVEKKEHQGVNEHDTLVSLGGLTLHSYRGADDNGKNFTLTLDKAGSASTVADNTGSSRNTYVYTNGQMVPVAKGTKVSTGMLERNKDSVVQFSRGGVPATVNVTWRNNIAQFTGYGKTSVLENGQSASFGYVTVTRADSAATTSYTYTFR